MGYYYPPRENTRQAKSKTKTLQDLMLNDTQAQRGFSSVRLSCKVTTKRSELSTNDYNLNQQMQRTMENITII
jgi:hypothetical protein